MSDTPQGQNIGMRLAEIGMPKQASIQPPTEDFWGEFLMNGAWMFVIHDKKTKAICVGLLEELDNGKHTVGNIIVRKDNL